MTEVFNLKVSTGRTDVYYPSLKPIIVQSTASVNISINVDPQTQEVLLVITQAFTTGDLTDFNIANLIDRQVIAWDAASSKFINATLTYAYLPPEVVNVPVVFPFSSYPGPGQIIIVPIVQPMQIPANFGSSIGYALNTAHANSVFNLSYIRAGVETPIGTVTFAAGSTNATFSTQASLNLAVNDVLKMTAPVIPDSLLSNLSISLLLLKL